MFAVCSAVNDCPVHCYKPDKREQIISVMRFSGPRMIYQYPVLGVMHIIDKQINSEIEIINK